MLPKELKPKKIKSSQPKRLQTSSSDARCKSSRNIALPKSISIGENRLSKIITPSRSRFKIIEPVLSQNQAINGYKIENDLLKQ